MRAAVYYGSQEVRVEHVPTPVLSPGEALLRVMFCGVCGTDIKTFMRGHPMFPPPCVLGHEPVGEIVALYPGDNSSSVAVGDTVVVATYIPCESCRLCLKGRQEICRHKRHTAGAFCEYIVVPREIVAKGVLQLPPGLSLKTACLIEPIACCLNAMENAPFDPGDSILIIGAGPMGLLMLELCKIRGASTVLISEPSDMRRLEASRRGARVANPQDRNIGQWAKDETRGEGVDVVFACVGFPGIFESLMTAARPGGKVCLFAGFPKNSPVACDPNTIHYDEIVLLGSFGFAPRHFDMALNLLTSGRLDVAGLITHEFELDEVGLALGTGASGEALKVILRVEQRDE